MKSAKSLLTVFVFTLFVFTLAQGVSVSAAEQEEFIDLIGTAETPEDHLKIADFYDAKALKMEKAANRHKSMGESYEKRSKPMMGMSKTCAKLSEQYMDSANSYKEMAKHHRAMAGGTQDHDSHMHEH
ncbi:MAG TPA: hypothetical protein VLB82_08640 [Thermodesulfobacteriota bacterium]|nr:hypothetical protein [Thermodesulfobacteriota bacterium]